MKIPDRNRFFLMVFTFLIFQVTLNGQINLNSGLAAYYPFNGNANDQSGNNYNGTVIGASLSEDRFGNPNQAYAFDGINDYIEIPDCILQPDLMAFSYSLWVKANDFNPMLLALFHGTPCGESHIATGSFDVKLNPQNWYGTAFSLTDEWIHIVGIYKKGVNLSAYIKGQFVSSNAIPDENIYAINYTSSSIGSYWRSYGYFWNGLIDDIRIYNRALSEDEIVTLYNEGNFVGNILITQVRQRDDGSGIVDIYYDITGQSSGYYLSLEVSFNGGSSYTSVSSSFISGDIGPISPGTNNHLIWNGKGSNNDTFSNQSKVKLIASINPPQGIPCPGTPTISYGGQVYNTVLIGSQCWLKENLNTGTRIDGSSEQTNNSIVEKYCYNNIESNCNIYGGLYRWDEAMQYSTTPGAQGICPAGWHIPTDNEYCILSQFLDPTVNCTVIDWSGSNVGIKMKSQSGWGDNGNGTNSSGFSALPGGFTYANGTFGDFEYLAHFWSSTKSGSFTAFPRTLHSNQNGIHRFNNTTSYGHSIRCIKN